MLLWSTMGLIIGLVAIGCTATAATPIPPDTVWVLQDDTVPAERTVQFLADGRLQGSAGCNGYFGSYSRDGEALTISELGSTEMWCDDLMDAEAAFLADLQAVTAVQMTEDGLVLKTAGSSLQFTEAKDQTLTGTRWQLSGVVAGDAINSMAIDENIYLEFAEGQLSGNSGCNSFNGSYTVAGNSLALGQMMQTLRACGDERDQREMTVMAALAQVKMFEIERNQLTLQNSDGQALLYFTATA